MVDTSLFVSMGGTQQAMHSLQVLSNNLANTNTIGFRADYEVIKTYPQLDNSQMQATRYFSKASETYSDFRLGPIITTGGDLDVAIDGPGFIAVQTKEGNEAYTRAGNLSLSQEGFLVTAKGDLVLGSKGVINIPPAKKVSIGERGNITAQLLTQSENELTELGSIKLVDVPVTHLKKGADGLFHLSEGGDGQAAQVISQDSIRMIPGSLEGSNVNPVKALIDLIDITRQFEIQSKLMSTVDDNAKNSNHMLNVTD